jgi:RNA polymerase sigma factor (sigma-70 family)
MSTQGRKHHDLGTSSEAILFWQAQHGCQASMNRLMVQHDGLVQAAVRRQVLGELPFAEALQAGRIGLWRAILGYDVTQGNAFSTYAWPSIVRQVWRAAKSQRDDRLSVGEEVLAAEPAADPALAWEEQAVVQAVHNLVYCLPGRLRQVMVARYGLAGGKGQSYRQIGASLGCSGEWARRLHTEALVWLRHPIHSQTLRSLVGRHSVADYEWADAQAQGWLRQRGGRHG